MRVSSDGGGGGTPAPLPVPRGGQRTPRTSVAGAPRSAFSVLRQLDLLYKPLEEFTVRTTTGGVVTLAATALMVLLFLSELKLFATVRTEHALVVDTTRGDTIQINVRTRPTGPPCAAHVARPLCATRGRDAPQLRRWLRTAARSPGACSPKPVCAHFAPPSWTSLSRGCRAP